jgi:hypothetical protein
VKAPGLLALALSVASISQTASADNIKVFTFEEEAQKFCAPDKVVWVYLDRGRYYDRSDAAFRKYKNGIYACENQAHAHYRPAKD